MEKISFKGKIAGFTRDIFSRKFNLVFETDEDLADYIDEIKNQDLTIEVKQFRQKRSLDANALLWKCLGEIAEVLSADAETLWKIYIFACCAWSG